MKNLSFIIRYLGFSIALFLLVSKPACANGPLTFMAFSGSPLGTIGIFTFGIGSLVVFAIESFVLKKVAGVDWQKAITAALVMNIVSTIFGAAVGTLIGYMDCYIVIAFPVVLIGIWIALVKMKYSNGFISLTLLCLLFGIFIIGLVKNSSDASRAGLWLCIVIQLIFGFGLTLAFEAFTISKYLPREKIEKGLILANVTSYIFLFLMAPIFWPSPVDMYIASSNRNLIYSGRFWDAGDAFNLVYRKTLSTPELLGIIKIDSNHSSVVAEEAIRLSEGILLEKAYKRGHGWGQLENQYTVIAEFTKRILSLPGLSADRRADLEWLGTASIFWRDVTTAILEDDQEIVRSLVLKWYEEEAVINSPKYRGHSDNFDPLNWVKRFTENEEHNDISEEMKALVAGLVEEYGD